MPSKTESEVDPAILDFLKKNRKQISYENEVGIEIPIFQYEETREEEKKSSVIVIDF